MRSRSSHNQIRSGEINDDHDQLTEISLGPRKSPAAAIPRLAGSPESRMPLHYSAAEMRD